MRTGLVEETHLVVLLVVHLVVLLVLLLVVLLVVLLEHELLCRQGFYPVWARQFNI